jgi:hypothetical protein
MRNAFHITAVIPAKAGTQRRLRAWIPAFAGMTVCLLQRQCDNRRAT